MLMPRPLAVLPPVSTEGLTSADVGKLSETVREDMLKALREISTLSPEAEQQRPGIRRDESHDSHVPLVAAMDGGDPDISYGSADQSVPARARSSDSELRRRTSQSDDRVEVQNKADGDASAEREGKLVDHGTDDEDVVVVKRP